MVIWIRGPANATGTNGRSEMPREPRIRSHGISFSIQQSRSQVNDLDGEGVSE